MRELLCITVRFWLLLQDKSDLETKSTRKLYEDMLNVEDGFVKVGT